MVSITRTFNSFRSQPGYTAMRGLARFPLVRSIVAEAKGALQARGMQSFLADCEARLSDTAFPSLDRHAFVSDLRANGLAFGLELPAGVVNEIRDYADRADTYADRNPGLGFKPSEHAEASQKLGKPILLGQYFNTRKDCPAIARLANDPLLLWVAASYLKSLPTFVGTNLWWTFPVKASDEDRNKHAHLFHRDVDDFRFFKYFFYLTDVPEGEGAHVCVVASNSNPPITRRGDRWNIRRYSDEEVQGYYPKEQIKEICGKAGIGFAEDTLCIHKGSTPKSQPRLLLQIQFALFDYGVMDDEKPSGSLKRIPGR